MCVLLFNDSIDGIPPSIKKWRNKMQNTNIKTQTTAVDTAKAFPALNLEQIGVPCTVTSEPVAPEVRAANKPNVDYTPKLSVERAMPEDQEIVAMTRGEYVVAFRAGVQKTARSTLEMCRVVYEASRSLDSYEFSNFCKEIGFKDWSSTVRKFIAIGKVYPRFIQYADQLPCSWTNIYLITQIPADTFEQCLQKKYSLKNLKGRELNELLNSTKEIEQIDASLSYDKKKGGYTFGKVMFTKRIDDVDWRAAEKAFAEIEARLPIKFIVEPEMLRVVEARRQKHYEATKKYYKGIELKPDLWDIGEEANAVYTGIKKTEALENVEIA
jgi:hypothetical protein